MSDSTRDARIARLRETLAQLGRVRALVGITREVLERDGARDLYMLGAWSDVLHDDIRDCRRVLDE